MQHSASDETRHPKFGVQIESKRKKTTETCAQDLIQCDQRIQDFQSLFNLSRPSLLQATSCKYMRFDQQRRAQSFQRRQASILVQLQKARPRQACPPEAQRIPRTLGEFKLQQHARLRGDKIV